MTQPSSTEAPTELPRIAQRFDYTPWREADFRARPGRAFLQYRDVGLRGATGGLMRAEHIRLVAPHDGQTGWHCHMTDFQFVYVLRGQLHVDTEDGETVRLGAGDCAHLPGWYRHHERFFSPDFEVLELTAPAEVRTVRGREAPADVPVPDAGRIARFVADHDRPQAYKVGEGPRRFLAYRDPGVTAATGRRVNINIVRNSVAGDASTGWHFHTLSCQFIYVLRGWSRVAVEGHGEYRITPGDAMTIPHGLKHDVTGFSADFTVLELNIPADYETVACAAPARQVG